MNLGDIESKIYLTKTVFIAICTLFTAFKISNYKEKSVKNIIFIFLYTAITSIFTSWIKYKFNSYMGVTCLILCLSILCSQINKGNLGYCILTIIISLSINYILFFVVILLSFIINKIYIIKNDFINLGIMMVIHVLLLYRIQKIKKLKNGITFFNKNSQNSYLDVVILNIGVCLLFSFIVFVNRDFFVFKNFFIGFIILAIIMFVTIQKSIQLYYKHKLLVREIEETKEELNNKNEEIQKLEQENLNFSKKSHSLAHKQKALEYKLNQLMLNSETAEELEVKRNLENISKELYVNQVTVELSKTDIPEIDNMLSFMQSECRNNNIDFDLQIIGNIYYMINNLISKEELEILLADHIKDAIIAINHTDSINKSILVKLGQIDDCYGIYIYDSGIEFEKETLENLGKKPSTTHRDEGGTGMGFMNTFDTLRKHKASLIINEIGKPSKDNYTKVLMFKFDGKDEFKVISYKEN